MNIATINGKKVTMQLQKKMYKNKLFKNQDYEASLNPSVIIQHFKI